MQSFNGHCPLPQYEGPYQQQRKTEPMALQYLNEAVSQPTRLLPSVIQSGWSPVGLHGSKMPPRPLLHPPTSVRLGWSLSFLPSESDDDDIDGPHLLPECKLLSASA